MFLPPSNSLSKLIKKKNLEDSNVYFFMSHTQFLGKIIFSEKYLNQK